MVGARTWYPAADERNGIYQLQKAEERAVQEHAENLRRIDHLRQLRLRRDLGRGPPLRAAHNVLPISTSVGAGHHPLCNAGLKTPAIQPRGGMQMQPSMNSQNNKLTNNQMGNNQMGSNQMGNKTMGNNQVGNSQNRQTTNNQQQQNGGKQMNGNSQTYGNSQNMGTQNHNGNQQNNNTFQNNGGNQGGGFNGQKGQNSQNQSHGNMNCCSSCGKSSMPMRNNNGNGNGNQQNFAQNHAGQKSMQNQQSGQQQQLSQPVQYEMQKSFGNHQNIPGSMGRGNGLSSRASDDRIIRGLGCNTNPPGSAYVDYYDRLLFSEIDRAMGSSKLDRDYLPSYGRRARSFCGF